MSKILIVNTDKEFRNDLSDEFTGYDVFFCSMSNVRHELKEKDINVVVIDHFRKTGLKNIELLKFIAQSKKKISVIIIGEERDNEVEELGLFDCVLKNTKKVKRAALRAVEIQTKDKKLKSYSSVFDDFNRELFEKQKQLSVILDLYTKLLKSLA